MPRTGDGDTPFVGGVAGRDRPTAGMCRRGGVLRNRFLICARDRSRLARLDQAVTERPDRLARWRHADQSPRLDHRDPAADLAHHVSGVRHDDDRASFLLELVDPIHALLLEPLVADGENLVDEEDVGVDVYCHGKTQPHVHAR